MRIGILCSDLSGKDIIHIWLFEFYYDPFKHASKMGVTLEGDK
ncbi:hypothetical protein [Paenibacillus pectinilyticus]|nr:hypothetical protein [Paenibacillus pectinilyticus]